MLSREVDFYDSESNRIESKAFWQRQFGDGRVESEENSSEKEEESGEGKEESREGDEVESETNQEQVEDTASKDSEETESVPQHETNSQVEALLRSVKSIQTLHLPLFFLTTTTLASHFGYCTLRMNPALSRFLTSSLMIASLERANFLLFCLIGWYWGSTCSLCMIISGSIPGISTWDQAKQSELDLRKSINLLQSPPCSLVPILRRRIWSPSANGTSSISSTSSSSVC
ncbi:hypothetical protein Bca4012_065533 [Brassica carinata]